MIEKQSKTEKLFNKLKEKSLTIWEIHNEIKVNCPYSVIRDLKKLLDKKYKEFVLKDEWITGDAPIGSINGILYTQHCRFKRYWLERIENGI